MNGAKWAAFLINLGVLTIAYGMVKALGGDGITLWTWDPTLGSFVLTLGVRMAISVASGGRE